MGTDFLIDGGVTATGSANSLQREMPDAGLGSFAPHTGVRRYMANKRHAKPRPSIEQRALNRTLQGARRADMC
jgi:hypothetical protein